MQNNKFVLTATFCYVCPHVQINGMGYDAVYAQTKENHYVDLSTEVIRNSLSITDKESFFSLSDTERITEPISENDLEKIKLYAQGNTVKIPREEFIRRYSYSSPGDGELDMRKLGENEQGQDD